MAATGFFTTDSTKWSAALERLGQPDVYFRKAYATLYENAQTTAVAFVYDDGENLFFMPVMKEQIPGTDYYDIQTPYGYGGPVCSTEDSAFLKLAWDAFAKEAASENIVCGLFKLHPLLENHKLCLPDFVQTFEMRKTVYVDVGQSYDDIWASWKKGNKSAIKKAVREGVTVEQGTGEKMLVQFGCYYRERMAELDAVEFYFFDDAYFKNIHQLGEEAYRVYLAHFEGKIIGGLLSIYGEQFDHYHLAGVSQDYFKLGPNNLLMNEQIKTAIARPNATKLHLGGGRTGAEDDGLLAYKKRFSKNVTGFYVGESIYMADAYNALCQQWETQNPDKKDQFAGRLLRYRM